MKSYDPDHDCPECGGTGKESAACPQCYERGVWQDCETCDGSGFITWKCNACNGGKTLKAYQETQTDQRVRQLLKKKYGTPTPSSIRDYWLK